MAVERKQRTTRPIDDVPWTDCSGLTVGQLMRCDVACVREGVWADRDAEFMRAHGLERAAVVDYRGRPRGVVCLADLDRVLAGATVEPDAFAARVQPCHASVRAIASEGGVRLDRCSCTLRTSSDGRLAGMVVAAR